MTLKFRPSTKLVVLTKPKPGQNPATPLRLLFVLQDIRGRLGLLLGRIRPRWHAQRSLLPVAHPNLPDSLYEDSFDRVLGLVNQFVDSLNFNVIRNRDFTDFERRIQAEN